MFSYAQSEALKLEQKKFLDFPGVKMPFETKVFCQNCGAVHVQLKCCKSKWCPICNLKTALKIANQFRRYLAKFPKLKKTFLTLTWKNISEIQEDTFQIFRNDFTKKFLRNREIKKDVIGGLYAFDYTINNITSQYNFHLHTITFLENYISQKKISEVWKNITGNSSIVDIRKIKNLSQGINEVLKYIQSNKLLLISDEEKKNALIKAIGKIRRFSKFGKVYKQKLDKQPISCSSCRSNKLDYYFRDENNYNHRMQEWDTAYVSYQDRQTWKPKFYEEDL